ncbi:MAG: hypothetical protein HOP28_15830 [Gemmatimonadales bacterium]|nr:hypothetical protein [Gemmatimonadales bacterium]
MTVWISPAILEWAPFIESYRTRPFSEARRPYEHWQHADVLLAGASSEFHRIDIVTTLKRAVELRLKPLNEIYAFRRIPLPAMPEDRLTQLSYLGIIRPLLIARLIDLRNRIEHQDAEPPTTAHCAELTDVVWYFLRSTETLLRQVIIDAGLDASGGRHDEHHHIRLRWDPPKNLGIEFQGWLPHTWVSESVKPHFLAVEPEELSRAVDHFTGPFTEDDRTLREALTRHRRRDPKDVWLRGKLISASPGAERVYHVLLGL